jgi:exodeoxyribonuclease V alpha subunit
MKIIFDDRSVIYDISMLDDIEHAYAITVHKSQGSEYPIVVMPTCSAAQMLQTRNLLYTAVTRAQKMVVLVGREEVISQMVKNNHQTLRYTGLAKRLRIKQDNTID